MTGYKLRPLASSLLQPAPLCEARGASDLAAARKSGRALPTLTCAFRHISRNHQELPKRQCRRLFRKELDIRPIAKNISFSISQGRIQVKDARHSRRLCLAGPSQQPASN